MRFSPLTPRLSGWQLAAAALCSALVLGACDNYAVVLGGAWPPPNIGAEGSLGQEAFLPADGAWIKAAAPSIEEAYPSGSGVHSESPVVVRFSETVAEDGLQGAFRLTPSSGIGTLPVAAQLVGDGRIAVLVPSLDLTAGETYTLSVAEGAEVTDLTGQALQTVGDLTTFTVADSDPATPTLVTTWPEDGATGMSAIGQVVAVFDRPMNAGSFNQNSWVVNVDGVAPVFDPNPAPLTLLDSLFPVLETRVWTWASVDNDDQPVDLGAGKPVTFALSPSTAQLTAVDGGVLPTTNLDWTLAAQPVPTGGALGTEGLVPSPSDAIGIANLTSGDPKALTLTVDVPGALSGDVLRLYMFGSTFDEEGEPAQTIAFERSKTLSAAASQVTFDLADLDLVFQTSPLGARFADGDVTFAFGLQRGDVVTPVRNLDVDPATASIDDAVLDTVAPTVEELFGETGGIVVSDQRGLQLAGRASERLRAAEVSTALGDNGVEAEVSGSQGSGSFLTRPVSGVDVIAPASQPVAFTLTVYDQAMNPATVATTGSYVQKGVVGPTPVAPGGTVLVEAFDALSGAPLVGARAYVHVDDGASFPIASSATTLATGLASVTLPVSGDHILTVVADGYDIVSLMNVEAARVSVPLAPSGALPGAVGGLLGGATSLSQQVLGSLTLRYADPRFVPGTVGLAAGDVCTQNPFGGGGLSCPFGPVPVAAGRLGAVTVMGGNFALPAGSFNASASLQAFDLQLPFGPLEAAGAQTAQFSVGLLSEPGVDPLDLPVEMPQLVLNAAGIAGVDLGSLEDDAGTSGEPFVTAETKVPGMPGAIPVGQGQSADQGGGVWNLRLAAPGAVLPMGTFDGVVLTDLYLNGTLVDTNGARSGRRVRMSQAAGLPTANQLDLVDAPTITSPVATASGAGYDIVFDNVITDAEGTNGIVGAEVVDQAGRVWRLYARDPGDGAPGRVHLVDFGAFDTGLASGPTVARAFAVGGIALNYASFLWSDIERDWQLGASGAPVAYTVP